MGSSSGTYSGSSALQNSGSEEDLQKLMDQRKRKRMISNRESARRSRQRKQKHLDELMNHVDQLRKENNQIIAAMNVTTQHYLNVEAENSVLRAQETELSQRLQSLNEIVAFLNTTSTTTSTTTSHMNGGGLFEDQGLIIPPSSSSFACVFEESFLHDPFMANTWSNNLYANQQFPLMASADLLQY